MRLLQNIRKTTAKLLSAKEIGLTFLRFYAVGFLLFVLPFTRELFISLIAISLLLVIGVVLYKHREWNYKTVLYFLFIAVSSFFLEMLGTTTGKIFGTYFYDRGLGIQLNHTPLIIGLNWVFLVYASHDIAERYTAKPYLRVLMGAAFMVIYDVVMEWVAPVMQMWHFDTGYPPFANFLTWFITALVFHSGMELLHIHTRNFAARVLFLIQILFFLAIGLFSAIFIP